jgi:phospholipase A1
MRNIMKIKIVVLLILLNLYSFSCMAQTATTNPTGNTHVNGPVEARAKSEEKIPPNYFAITLYKPTYVLPYYYTASPYNAVYQNNTPNNEQLKSSEFKYQLSFKVPVWKNIFHYPSSLFIAYTQLSYWQLYNRSAFFRETDYEPELFLANEVNYHLINNWHLNFLNIGANHQSNGFGNTLERSWNRVFLEATSSTDHWMVSIRPWYILSTDSNNEDIGSYLGYGSILVSYKFHQQVFSVQAHSLIENHAKRATAELTWSFPITHYIKGYVQLFSGYGQSLIEYNHHTNSAGIGIAFNDWI